MFLLNDRSRSWRNTIRVQRWDLEALLADNSSLHRELPECLVKAYPQARREAIEKTGLLRSPWPDTCPWTLEQILEENWLPDHTQTDALR